AADVPVAFRAHVHAELTDAAQGRDVREIGRDLEVFLATESQIGELETEVLAGSQAELPIDVAVRGRQLQAEGRVEPQVRVAAGQPETGARQPEREPGSVTVAVEQGPFDRILEVERP